MQGFFFSRPVPPVEFEALLKTAPPVKTESLFDRPAGAPN
jgi:hypothetical protein